ncbi:MAG: co-chaperone GroES [Candidatus Moraniibacteriota bacterium]|nr:MAG: co-chaperone GroES [Candidatus Moranbacteria bacterium]
MSTTITPLGENVLIKMEVPETQTAAGIYIPETASNDKSQQGVVEAIGESEKITVKKGQTVIFKKYGGEEVKVDGKEYVIVKIEDVIAVVE